MCRYELKQPCDIVLTADGINSYCTLYDETVIVYNVTLFPGVVYDMEHQFDEHFYTIFQLVAENIV